MSDTADEDVQLFIREFNLADGENKQKLAKRLCTYVERYLSEIVRNTKTPNAGIQSLVNSELNRMDPDIIDALTKAIMMNDIYLYRFSGYNPERARLFTVGFLIQEAIYDFCSAREKAQDTLRSSANSELNGGKGCYCTKKKTDKRIKYKNKDRVVYEGPRGGKYIRVKDTWVSINKL